MTFRVTNTFTGQTTLDANQLDVNFDDIENKFNGNITGADMTANAGITNAQLLHDKIDLILTAQVLFADVLGIGGGALVPTVAFPLSTLDPATNYTVVAGSLYLSDTGNAGPGFNYQANLATIDSNTGVLTNTTQIVLVDTITPVAPIPVANTPFAKAMLINDGTLTMDPTEIAFINFHVEALPGGIAVGDQFFVVSFRLRADTGLVG